MIISQDEKEYIQSKSVEVIGDLDGRLVNQVVRCVDGEDAYAIMYMAIMSGHAHIVHLSKYNVDVCLVTASGTTVLFIDRTNADQGDEGYERQLIVDSLSTARCYASVLNLEKMLDTALPIYSKKDVPVYRRLEEIKKLFNIDEKTIVKTFPKGKEVVIDGTTYDVIGWFDNGSVRHCVTDSWKYVCYRYSDKYKNV